MTKLKHINITIYEEDIKYMDEHYMNKSNFIRTVVRKEIERKKGIL